MNQSNIPHNQLKADLKEFLESQPNAPFLFIGSGIAQRYIETETWADLLELFAAELKPYDYYRSRSGNDLIQRATYIAKDYFDWWWTNRDEEYKKKFAGFCNAESSPMKIDISEYLKVKGETFVDDPDILEELEVLKEVRVAGIITTNWDMFLENLFPDYHVFVGQSEMITGRVHGVGEIYKIHGSCTDPESLVLTNEDYDDFNRRKAYLAAKLMTIFVEHPIIFLGYRLEDPNIQDMIRTIANAMNKDEQELLTNNLIFIRRHREHHAEDTSYVTGGSIATDSGSIQVTEIFTNQFKMIYEILSENSLKIPPKILRFFKEQSYELIMSKDPTQRLKVTNIENIDRFSELSFVVGVGATGSDYAERGFAQINNYDLAREILLEDVKFDHNDVLEVLSGFSTTHFFPVFHYFKQCGLSKEDTSLKYPRLKRFIDKSPEFFQTNAFKRQYEVNWASKTTTEIINENPSEKAAIFIVFQKSSVLELDAFKSFLCDNMDKLKTKESYSSNFRKALCYYDWLVNYPWHEDGLIVAPVNSTVL